MSLMKIKKTRKKLLLQIKFKLNRKNLDSQINQMQKKKKKS